MSNPHIALHMMDSNRNQGHSHTNRAATDHRTQNGTHNSHQNGHVGVAAPRSRAGSMSPSAERRQKRNVEVRYWFIDLMI